MDFLKKHGAAIGIGLAAFAAGFATAAFTSAGSKVKALVAGKAG